MGHLQRKGAGTDREESGNQRTPDGLEGSGGSGVPRDLKKCSVGVSQSERVEGRRAVSWFVG